MGKPPTELLPTCTELIPRMIVHLETFLLVTPEHIVEFTCGSFVNDNGILLKVTLQTTGIQIGTAHGAIASIDHHNLGMMEAGLVEPYTSTTLLKLAGLIQRTIGSQGNITLGRQHNLDLHPAADGTCECPRNGGNELLRPLVQVVSGFRSEKRVRVPPR